MTSNPASSDVEVIEFEDVEIPNDEPVYDPMPEEEQEQNTSEEEESGTDFEEPASEHGETSENEPEDVKLQKTLEKFTIKPKETKFFQVGKRAKKFSNEENEKRLSEVLKAIVEKNVQEFNRGLSSMDATFKDDIILIESAKNDFIEGIAELLWIGGVNISAQNNIALKTAAKNGFLSLAKMIIEHELFEFTIDSVNEAIDLARENNHSEIVKLLFTNEAYFNDPESSQFYVHGCHQELTYDESGDAVYVKGDFLGADKSWTVHKPDIFIQFFFKDGKQDIYCFNATTLWKSIVIFCKWVQDPDEPKMKYDGSTGMADQSVKVIRIPIRVKGQLYIYLDYETSFKKLSKRNVFYDAVFMMTMRVGQCHGQVVMSETHGQLINNSQLPEIYRLKGTGIPIPERMDQAQKETLVLRDLNFFENLIVAENVLYDPKLGRETLQHIKNAFDRGDFSRFFITSCIYELITMLTFGSFKKYINITSGSTVSQVAIKKNIGYLDFKLADFLESEKIRKAIRPVMIYPLSLFLERDSRLKMILSIVNVFNGGVETSLPFYNILEIECFRLLYFFLVHLQTVTNEEIEVHAGIVIQLLNLPSTTGNRYPFRHADFLILKLVLLCFSKETTLAKIRDYDIKTKSLAAVDKVLMKMLEILLRKDQLSITLNQLSLTSDFIDIICQKIKKNGISSTMNHGLIELILKPIVNSINIKALRKENKRRLHSTIDMLYHSVVIPLIDEYEHENKSSYNGVFFQTLNTLIENTGQILPNQVLMYESAKKKIKQDAKERKKERKKKEDLNKEQEQFDMKFKEYNLAKMSTTEKERYIFNIQADYNSGLEYLLKQENVTQEDVEDYKKKTPQMDETQIEKIMNTPAPTPEEDEQHERDLEAYKEVLDKIAKQRQIMLKMGQASKSIISDQFITIGNKIWYYMPVKKVTDTDGNKISVPTGIPTKKILMGIFVRIVSEVNEAKLIESILNDDRLQTVDIFILLTAAITKHKIANARVLAKDKRIGKHGIDGAIILISCAKYNEFDLFQELALFYKDINWYDTIIYTDNEKVAELPLYIHIAKYAILHHSNKVFSEMLALPKCMVSVNNNVLATYLIGNIITPVEIIEALFRHPTFVFEDNITKKIEDLAIDRMHPTNRTEVNIITELLKIPKFDPSYDDDSLLSYYGWKILIETDTRFTVAIITLLLGNANTNPMVEDGLLLKASLNKRLYYLAILLLKDSRVDPSIVEYNGETGPPVIKELFDMALFSKPSDEPDSLEPLLDVLLQHRKIEQIPVEIFWESIERERPTFTKMLIDDGRILSQDGLLSSVIQHSKQSIISMNWISKLLENNSMQVSNEDLYVAIVSKFAPIVKLLLAHPKIQPSLDGNKSLEMAVEAGDIEILKLLLNSEKIDGSANMFPILEMAIVSKWVEGAEELMKITDPSLENNGLLILALGDTNMIRLLLSDSRVNPTARGNLLLKWLYTVEKHNTNFVKFVLGHQKVDPSFDNQYLLELIVTDRNPSLPFLKILLKDPRVDPSVKDNSFIKIATSNLALYTKAWDVIDLLIDDPRVDPSVNDNALLKIAIKENKTQIIMKLIKDVRVKDKPLPEYDPLETSSSSEEEDD